MSEQGGGEFLQRLLGDLLGLMGSAGSGTRNQLELARTLANSVATGAEPEPNPDPVARMELEQLARVAELHVTELTGMSPGPSGSSVELTVVGPGGWAAKTLDDWAFVLDAMTSPTEARPSSPDELQGGRWPPVGGDPAGSIAESLSSLEPSSTEGGRGDAADVVARFMATMGPMMAAMQLGSAVGHLARSTLGQYELPVPRPAERLLVVPPNVEHFAEEWSLPLDQVRLWICLRELTAHAVLTRPHVAVRFTELISEVVGGMAEDTAGLMGRLGDIDPTNPAALESLLEDPEALFLADPSPRRRRAAGLLEAVTAALLGYTEHVLDRAASRLLGGRSAIGEAWRRRQHDREGSDRAAELLLGLDLGPAQVDKGTAFVNGVLERAGAEGLDLLWSETRTLPTPAEVEAPGLWLERIRLGEEPSSSDD